MRVLAIYAVNEHINQLHLDAAQARRAAQASSRPSIARRVANAVRSAFSGNNGSTPQATASAA